LLGDYGWNIEDLPFLGDGNIQLELDPKRAWAEMYLREAPIDIMNTNRKQLLRIPGIGPKGTDSRNDYFCTPTTKLRLVYLYHSIAPGMVSRIVIYS